jgi:fimbrial isopeptide formation D2 family protein/uncharacterized repeat protein (TIGR01451 family)
MKKAIKKYILLEQLEERIFLDANPVAAAADAVTSEPFDQDHVEQPALTSTTEASAPPEQNLKTPPPVKTELSPATDHAAKSPAPTSPAEPVAAADPAEQAHNAVPVSIAPVAAGSATPVAAPATYPVAADSITTTVTDSGNQTSAATTTVTSETTSVTDPTVAAEPKASSDPVVTTATQPTVQTSAALEQETDDPFPVTAATDSAEVTVIDPMIGEDFTFTVSLDNNSPGTLYGPYIDLYFPSTGDDGDDGVTFVDATYLGKDVTATVQTFNTDGEVIHPYAVDATGTPIVISGIEGDTYVTLEMPFGSFTVDQPAAEVVVTAHIDEHQQVDGAGGSAQDFSVQVYNGYRYGANPLDNPTSDAPVGPILVGTQTFRPEVIRFEKEYIGPEQETATGPNYPRQYQVVIDIAEGQTISSLTLTEHLPNEIFYLGNDTVLVNDAATGFTVTSPNTSGNGEGIFTDGVLTVELDAPVTGTAADNDVVVTFDYYVPQYYADGSTPILDPYTGDESSGGTDEDRDVINDVEVSGDWTPTDSDDAPQHIVMDAEVDSAGNISGTPDNDEEIDAEAIAIQKSVKIATNTGVSGYNPGDIVEYTLNFQISDYFNLGNIQIVDILPDGLTLQTSGGHAPTFTINDETGSWSGNWAVGTNLTTVPQGDDDTELHFNVSAVAGGVDGILQGDLYGNATAGSPAVGTITYYALVKDEYQSTGDSSGPGDTSVDQGDVFTNNVTIEGQIYGDDGMGGLTSSGYDLDQDDSGASFRIEVGHVTKEIYAINGNTDLSGVTDANNKVHMEPGDTVTYRLQYDMPTSEFETFQLDDYLPLPVLNAGELTAATNLGLGSILQSATPPAAGSWYFHTNDTYADSFGAENIDVVIVATGGENRVSFIYDEHDDSTPLHTTIDILFTVTVADDPFADGLYLTNQVRGIEVGTHLVNSNTDSIVQIVLDEPELNIIKGVVETDNDVVDSTTPVFIGNNSVDDYFTNPGTTGFRGVETISSSWLDTHVINTNLTNIDAGDTATFAIVVENTGHRGAFDIAISDTLPDGFDASSLNLSVTDGAGTVLSWTGDLFTAGGITITDDSDGALAGVDGPNGSNVLVITYDLTALGSIQPLQTLTNTATLASYAGANGADNHIPGGLIDTAIATITAPTVDKVVSGTSETSTPGDVNVVIGETVQYTVTITVPEGSSIPDFTDTLDSGLALVSLDSISASGGLATSVSGGFSSVLSNAAIWSDGSNFSLDFGNLTNSDVANGTAETITITYTAVVLNSPGNNQDGSRKNDVDWVWTENGYAHTVSDSAPNVVIQEPALQVVKEVSNDGGITWVDNTNLDQGDTISYRITIQHSASSHEDAFDAVFTDALPMAGIDWSSATVTPSGDATTTFSFDAGTGAINATWDALLSGQSTIFIVSGGVLTNATAGQVITNTGSVSWESLGSDLGTPISPYNNLSYERTGNTSDPGTTANDYAASDPATITVAGKIDKTGSGDYAIGDTVTYNIVVTLPEGATNDLVVTDAIPAGMVYTGYSVDTTGFNGTVTTMPTVSTAAGDGNDLTFSFGAVTVATDNVTTTNSFTLRVVTRVADIASNQQGTGLLDHASMSYTNPLGGTTVISDSTDPTVHVVEPQITTLKTVADSVDAGTDAQPGETLTYTVRFENTGHSTAYEVNAADNLPDGIVFNAGSASAVDQGGSSVAVAVTDDGLGNLIIAGDWDIAVGDWVEVQYTATVMAAGFVSGPHTNTVDADWTSRDGVDPNERNYNDTGTSPVDGSQDTDDAAFTTNVTGSIGDIVFFDAFGNGGVFNASEGDVGISGVDVTLTADVNNDGTFEFTQTARTDAAGLYHFTSLAAFSNYIVTVNPVTSGGVNPTDLTAAGFTQTYDLNGATDHSATVSLTAGQTRTDVDFGYTGQNSVGDTVWYNVDGDNQQDVGEDGINGLIVELAADIDGDGTYEYNATTTTHTVGGVDGQYSFDHLPGGAYTVTITPPAGSTVNYDQDGGIATPNAVTPFTLAADEDRTDIDFGLIGTGSLGDTVWFDSDADTIQDGGIAEPGISGLTVTLTGDIDGDGSVDYTETTTTGANGTYSFNNLLGGTYSVAVDESDLLGDSANWEQTFDLNGVATPSVTSVILAPGTTRTDVDFGYTGAGSLGDRVWYDADRDGVQDAGENGLAGVEVIIFADIDGDGVAEYIDTAVTDASGNYLFTHLPATSYTTAVNNLTLPGGSTPTYDLDSATVSPDGIDIYTLALGENIDRVDFGYAGSGSIGDRVWRDTNGDGMQDAGETGIAGVTITLTGDLDHDGSADDTLAAVTDANGNYTFDNLFLGAYTVAVNVAGLPPGNNPTDDLDGVGTPNTADVTLTTGTPVRDDVDFGYNSEGTIGDTVWYDADGDSVQDAGELGLVNVTVTLAGDTNGDGVFDDVTLTDTTDASGHYLFDQLQAGTYNLTLTGLPAGMSSTADPDGGAADTATLILGGGETNLDQDFGYTGTGAIGDTIWNDLDGDGVQDAGETGIAGASVTLTADLNNDGTPDTLTVVTDANGSYTFEHLPADTYTVSVNPVTLPPGMAQTFDPEGAMDNSASVVLPAGVTNTTIDFGYQQRGTIGDTVWYDLDGDDAQDAGELGLVGVTVGLSGDTDGDGTPDVSLTTTTDTNGRYLFTNLAAGEYAVTVSGLPAGMTSTADPDGGADDTSSLTLTSGGVNLDQDFGYTGTGAIGDTIWNDLDGNGVQDAGETGLAGASVTLTADLNNDGTPDTLTVVTDANGNYSFDNLPANSYTITVDTATLPPGVVQTFDGQGALDNAATVPLAAGDTNNNVDFGYRQTGTIGDTVWYDMDSDGMQDTGEFGLANINVTLVGDLDGDGAVDDILATTTDSNGQYLFDRLPDGDYTITVDTATLPGGMEQTADPDGGNDNSSVLTLAAGGVNRDQDFGYTGTGTIGDTIWFDVDGDGVQDAGESGIPGVTVALTGDLNHDGIANETLTLTTDQNGHYDFTHLPVGSYTIAVQPATLPDGMHQTHDPDAVMDGTSTVVLAAHETNTVQDFGYTGAGTIGDTVWYDQDGDGIQDASEIGLAGVSVTLTADLNADGVGDVTLTTTTDGNGRYGFTNLPAGSFSVAVNPATLPGGMVQSGDPDSVLNNGSTVVLATGETNTAQDFGYTGTGSIGDTVWYDQDGDGILDAGEAGLAGATITLTGDLNHDGVANETMTAVTDGSGRYLFTNLAAGNYSLALDPATLPGGMVQTADPDAVMNNGSSVVLGAGESNTAQDFGYRGTGSIGDTVWYDVDGDGILDASEVGIPGVAVTLTGDFNHDGIAAETMTTITDAHGHYLFDNLPAGSYAIVVDPDTLPGGMAQTADPDAVLNDGSIVILDAGETNNTQDFGYTGTGSIGDQIWNDHDGNGVMDPGEQPLAGVEVCIGVDLDGDGTPDYRATTTTDANGVYIFDNLPSGRHTVCVNPDTLPPGIRPSVDPDGTLDNSTQVTLGAGEDNRAMDFGYQYPPEPEVHPSLPPALPPEEPGVVADAFFMHRQFDGDDEILFYPSGGIAYQYPLLPVSPVYTGHAEPGTTLFLTLYDAMGHQVGYQSVMADTAGNWLASFPGNLLYDMPHHMEIEQTISAYNASTAGMFNLRTYFSPNFNSMVFSTAALDVQTVFALLPSKVMHSMHGSNMAVVDIKWNDFYGYEFIAPSTHPANLGH